MHATATRPPRQRRKPVRKARLAQHPDRTPHGEGILDLWQDGKLTSFFIRRLTSEIGGVAFHLEKFDAHRRGDGDDVYDVLLNGQESSCCCKGFLRWGHCRHVEALTALRDANQL